MKEIDAFDLSILKILQKNNLTPQREIGNQIGLSAAAVNRRISSMEQLGIIKHNIAVVDREKAGHNITLIVEVSLESEKIAMVDQAKKRFKACPAVQQCYYVTGVADFILIIIVSSMAEYEQLTRSLFFSDENIKNFKTFVTMDVVKIGLEVPIEQ